MINKSHPGKIDHHWDTWAWLLILAGSCLRFYAAWLMQYIEMRDSAVVMLMAKHMAEGIAFPAFYYGQAYMGSLEPLVSAFLVKLLGDAPFSTSAGTALLGCISLVLVWRIARDCAGSRAGFIAATWTLVGSGSSLYLSAHPRGGYMTLLVFGLLTVLHAQRFAARAMIDGNTSLINIILCGLCAGLGWWSNQMVIVFMGTAVLILLPVIKYLFRKWAFAWALLAFFLGSLPWWCWNMTHEWATFSFSSSFGQVGQASGFHYLLLELPDIIGFDPWSNPVNKIRMTGLVIVLLFAFLAFVRVFREKGWRSPAFLSMAAAWLIVLIMCILYTKSHFSRIRTPRYLLPLVPGLAILAGIGIDHVLRHQSRLLKTGAWVLLFLIMPPSIFRIAKWGDNYEKQKSRWSHALELANFMEKKGVSTAQGDFLLYWVQVANRERGIVVNSPYDAYAPYNRLAAEASPQLFINNFRDIASFLNSTGAEWQETQLAGFKVIHDIIPPIIPHDYVLPADITTISVSPEATTDPQALIDENLDTSLEINLTPGRDTVIEVGLSEPTPLCGILILNGGELGLNRVQIDGQTPDGKWIKLLGMQPVPGYFWSGNRIYYEGFDCHQPFYFEPPVGGLMAFRITTASQKERHVRLPEILCLEKAQPANTSTVDTADWLTRIEQVSPDRLYAPRYLIEKWHGKLNPRIAVRSSFYLTRTVNQLAIKDDMSPPYLDISGRTALLIEKRDAPRSRRLLRDLGMSWKEQEDIFMVLIVIDPPLPEQILEPVIPLYWTARGLFSSDGLHDAEARASRLIQAAKAWKQDFPDRQLEALALATHLAPDWKEAGESYISALQEAGQPDQARAASERLNAHTLLPSLSAPGNFQNGISLVGISTEPTDPSPGDRLQVTYYWNLTRRAKIHNWSVFVHFRDKQGIVFQDDHNISDTIGKDMIRGQLYEKTFQIRRFINIPADISGDLDVCIGLVDPLTGEKSRVDSKYAERKKMIVIPAAIRLRK